jgi:hypothetical protein
MTPRLPNPWLRNGLFVALCLLGFAVLAAELIPRERRLDPRGVPFDRHADDEFRRTVDRVNAEFRASWEKSGLKPAPRGDELAVARRVSLGLAGTVPSLEEIRALEARPEGERVGWWVERLLEDRRSADYLAERLARAYVGTENGPFLVYRRRRFVHWLSDRLHVNEPYDSIVRALITGSGLWTDTPAVNFITATIDQNGTDRPSEEKLAARTARAFLGVRLDCVQCHDDNLGDRWRQRDFHQLAAFFSELRPTLTGIRDDRRQPYKYTYSHGDKEEVVSPRVPFESELLTKKGTRRRQLADWVTHRDNEAFARATVNRAWAILFGRALVEPVDDLPVPSENGKTVEEVLPPGLNALAEDFAKNGYDLRRLFRLIAATEAFQLDSRAEHEVTQAHEDAWAAFPIVRLRPEQVSGSLQQAARLRTIDAQSHILVQLTRFGRENDFVRRYGDAGDDEFGSHGGTIPQRLLMMNGELVKELTEDNLVQNAATRIAALAAHDDTAIEVAYLAVLARRPSDEEAAFFRELLHRKHGDERNRRVEDMYWMLFNSREFSWNH